MEYSEILYLIKKSEEKDEIGNILSFSETKNKSYAKKQSVKSKEYYNAIDVGITPTCEFVIKRLNYNNEEELEWNETRYKIVRTIDPKNKYDIVLVCSRKIGINEK